MQETISKTDTIDISLEDARILAVMCKDEDSPIRTLLAMSSGKKDDNIRLLVPASMVPDVNSVIAYNTTKALPPYPSTYYGMLEDQKRWDEAALYIGSGLAYPASNCNPKGLRCMDALPDSLKENVRKDMIRRAVYATLGSVKDPFLDLFTLPDRIETRPHSVNLRQNALISGSPCPKAEWQAPSTDGLVGVTAWLKRAFSDVPWFGSKGNETHGIVVAGGSLASALLGRPSGSAHYDSDTFDEQVFEGYKLGGDIGITETPPGDFDVFFCDMGVGSEEAAAIARADDAYSRLFVSLESFAGEAGYKVVACVKKNVVDLFVLEENHNVKFKVQMITRLFETPSHVLFGFDYSVCKFLFDGERTWATQDALDMLQSGYWVMYEHTMSTSGIHRAAKYLARYFGLHMMVPGVPQEVIDALELLAYHVVAELPEKICNSRSESTIDTTMRNFQAAKAAYSSKYGESKTPVMPAAVWYEGSVKQEYTGIVQLFVYIGRLHAKCCRVTSDYDDVMMNINVVKHLVDNRDADIPWRIMTQDCFTGALNPLPNFNLYADLGEKPIARFLRDVLRS